MWGLITLGLALLMLVAAVPLVVGPPMPRVSSWLRSRGVRDDEATVTATQAALQRIGLISGIVVVVLGVTALVADFGFYTAFVGYAMAVIVGTCVPLGGSSRRKADLAGMGSVRTPAAVLWTALVLSAVTVTLAVIVSLMIAGRTPENSVMTLNASFWMPDIDLRQLAIVAGISVLITACCLIGVTVVKRRQSIAGATADADTAVRDLCLWRICLGTLGGQLILFAAALPALQILTVQTPAGGVSESLVNITSAVGAGLMIAGILVTASAVLLPVWLQTRAGDETASTRYQGEPGGHSSNANRGLAVVEERPKE